MELDGDYVIKVCSVRDSSSAWLAPSRRDGEEGSSLRNMDLSHNCRGDHERRMFFLSLPSPHRHVRCQSIRFADIVVDPITSNIYHIESRPSEGGRNVIVNTTTGTDVVSKGWNVRTGVHEYGGAAAIVHGGVVYFSHYNDGRAYRVKDGGEPEAITPGECYH